MTAKNAKDAKADAQPGRPERRGAAVLRGAHWPRSLRDQVTLALLAFLAV